MRKLKLDKNISTRISALAMAGMIFVTSMAGCKKENNNNNNNNPIISTTQPVDNNETKNNEIINKVNKTREEIKNLFNTMNQDIVNNASLIMLLDEIAKEDENGKINSDIISNFKAKINTDNMMSDFNSFLDTLEQSMIEKEELISVSNLVIDSDKEILSKIELITSNIINGTKEEKILNFDLIYTLFVLEDEITYDELTFDVRDLSYSARAIAQGYARTCAYYAKDYITEEQYEKIDNRTNNQNNKAYIKTKLEILANEMVEKSQVDVITLFKEEYSVTKVTVNGKINVSEDNLVDLVNYINLEYLDSDKVSNKDKNQILGEYEDKKVSNVLLTIDAINEYNQNNNNDIVLFSNLIVDNYKETETGKIDKVALDYIQFNAIMLLNTTTLESTAKEIYNNLYFQNIYKYFTKQNLTHKYNENNEVSINYQDISDGAKFVANEIIIYIFSKRPNIKEYEGYDEKINTNLEETIQYIQNIITGECEKVDVTEFVKTK